MSFFSKLFKSKKKPVKKRDKAHYEDEKHLALSDNVDDRLALAINPNTHLEILYYLGQNDPDPAVRKAVAENGSAPLQATPELAEDEDEDVRLALARRLLVLLPELNDHEQSQLYAFAAQALGVLALDEVLKVRLALSSALKDKAYTPPDVASKLARDIERQVSEPVLRLCAAVPDADLIDILKEHPDPWIVAAIAGRETLSGDVSDAVIDTHDRPAGEILIANAGATIGEETLLKIVAKAKEFPEWHKPLALRSHLPGNVIQEIAGFVDEEIKELLEERTDLDEETRKSVQSATHRRAAMFVDDNGDRVDPHVLVQQLFREQNLTEEAIQDALALRERDFVIQAMALRGRIDPEIIKSAIDARAPKALVALAWKAGLTMRFALEFQKNIGKIAPNDLLYPSGGTEFPMSDDDMRWQLDTMGIAA